MRARGLAAALAAAGLALPAPVAAQSLWRATPSVAFAVVTDSNLFARASAGHADVISRMTPSIDTEYRSKRVTALGRVALDAERFATHTMLTSLEARRFGSIEARYQVAPRLAVRGDALILATNMPGELNSTSGLVLARGRARRVAFGHEGTYQLSPRTEASIEYAYSQDRLEQTAPMSASATTMTLLHRASRRHTARVDYIVRRFAFSTDDRRRSQSVTVGWTHDLSRRMSVSLSGGPRIGDGAIAPELSASLAYRHDLIDWAVSYGRLETTLIGLAGTADTHTLSIAAAYGPRDGWRLRTAPAIMSTSQSSRAARVYRIGAGVSRPLSRVLALDIAYEHTLQRGDLYLSTATRIARHVTTVNLQLLPGTRTTR
jgi:hypothetical protein